MSHAVLYVHIKFEQVTVLRTLLSEAVTTVPVTSGGSRPVAGGELLNAE